MNFTQEMIDSLVVDVGEAVDTSGLRFIDLFAGIGGMRIPFDENRESMNLSNYDK